MDYTLLLSIFATSLGLISLISSVINLSVTKKEFKAKIKLANLGLSTNKMNTNIDQVTNTPLKTFCNQTVLYFNKISENNDYIVNIYKILDNNYVQKVSSSINTLDIYKYKIDENTEFNETATTLKPYYRNNISYFNKQGNEYLSENKNWEKQYQSIICSPIINNNKIHGFLSVEISKPLNDLINIDEITEFLELECTLISINNEFIDFKGNGWDINVSTETDLDQIYTQGCYQWEESVNVSNDDDNKDNNATQ